MTDVSDFSLVVSGAHDELVPAQAEETERIDDPGVYCGLGEHDESRVEINYADELADSLAVVHVEVCCWVAVISCLSCLCGG